MTGQAVNFVFEPVMPTGPTPNGYSIDLTEQAQQTRAATIVDAALGQVQYVLTGADTAVPGDLSRAVSIHLGRGDATLSGGELD